MAKRRWTVVLVPHGSEPSKIIEVSYSLLKVAAGAVLATVVVSLLLGYASLTRTVDVGRSEKLEKENAVLAAAKIIEASLGGWSVPQMFDEL